MIEFLQHPIVLALLSAQQIHFAFIAWIVILIRLVRRRFTKIEFGLLALFLGLVLVEFVQLSMTFHAGPFMNGLTEEEIAGFNKYFGPMGPLLWAWAAVGFADLWNLPKPKARRIARICVTFILFIFTFFMSLPHLYRNRTSGDGMDAVAAAERMAPIIKKDYAGPKRHENFPYSLGEYFTSKRPTVASDYSAAAWFADGQSAGANLGFYPYPLDYVFLKPTGINRGMDDLNPDDYEFIARVKGTQNVWWSLFRRKGTPHR